MSAIKEYIQFNLPGIESCLSETVAGLNPLVKPVATHILEAGGKRLRPMLCLLTARALGYEGKDIYPLAAALELIHSATLLHDDILDQAEMRRGKTTAHIVFGVNEAILAGDALLAVANRIVTEYESLPLVRCISQAIYWTAVGEIQEIQQLKEPSLTVEKYMEIVVGKTGYLLQTCCQSGAIMSGSLQEQVEAAKTFGLNLGIAFQLVDDALDYSVSHLNTGKPKGGDLREGKLTLPLILFLQGMSREKRDDLLKKIKGKGLDPFEQQWVLEEMERKGLSRKTRDESNKYLQAAARSLNRFPDTRERDLLYEVLEYIKDRED
ncbi:MAG: polyprenyl synthetase family protein [Desulfohalobiaceae bacterium]|nr:polyprenyl synthetase family protein [Desulfohalobiaceae bacterium]